MSSKRIVESSDEYQRWIDELLTSPEARSTTPAALQIEVRRALNRKRQWIMARRVVGAAAVAALICWPHDDQVGGDRQVVSRRAALTTHAHGKPPFATFVPNRDVIVLQQEQVAPNVTVVELIPTTNAAKRWRREALARSIRLRIKSRGGKS